MDENINANKNANKKVFAISIAAIIVIALIALSVAGYFYWKKIKSQYGEGVLNEAGDTAGKITESATQGVLPSINTNVLENKPDINPAAAANPIKNVKVNPF